MLLTSGYVRTCQSLRGAGEALCGVCVVGILWDLGLPPFLLSRSALPAAGERSAAGWVPGGVMCLVGAVKVPVTAGSGACEA